MSQFKWIRVTENSGAVSYKRRTVCMKNSLVRAFVAAANVTSFALVFDDKARASDWGCQVILCLSNPGSPMQYSACRPPIQKLWRWLAKGKSFPTCSGVGFSSSGTGYEPYYCDDGYRLTGSFEPRGRSATCVSTIHKRVSDEYCSFRRKGQAGVQGAVVSQQWKRQDGRLQCIAQVTTRPNVRHHPHYIDVIIEGVGKQRVWY